jgi:hypothetical protein
MTIVHSSPAIPFLTPLAELQHAMLKFASIQDIMRFVDKKFRCDEKSSVAYLQYFTPKHYVMCALIEDQETFLAEFPALKQAVEQYAGMTTLLINCCSFELHRRTNFAGLFCHFRFKDMLLNNNYNQRFMQRIFILCQ